MSKIVNMACMTMLIVLVALTTALLQPEGARDLGLEAALSALGGERLLPTGPNREEMERIAAKQGVIEALLEDRLTLFEAAAHYRRLKNPRVDLRLAAAGDSDEERLCRQVIRAVGQELRYQGRDIEAVEITTRYEEELRRYLEEHDQVTLPDVVDLPHAWAHSVPVR